MSDAPLHRGAWIDETWEVSTFSGESVIRDIVSDEITRITKALSDGLDAATLEMVIAYLETRGYVVLKPGVSVSHRFKQLQGQVMLLQEQVDFLRKGGSIAP